MYPATVRRQIVQRLRLGEAVAAVAAETGIAQATLFRWKRQALIDAGVVEGTPSVEADELAAARKRIAALEAELALTRDACELFDEQAVVPPKRRRAIAEGLIARGYSARSACRITGLARSLLQYYRRRPVPDREIRRLIVSDTITEIHQRSRGTYGGRRIRAALLADYDMNVNPKLIRSIMSEHGLHGLPHPPRRIPNLIRVNNPADLVNRQFMATRPNELWCTDITEHPARDGKVYCCAILDCFSRMIVARTFSTTPDTALVNNAVNMAVANRKRYGATILHSDHGSQFTSWSFGENVRRWGLLASLRHRRRLLRQRRHGVVLGQDAGRAAQHPQMGDHLGTGCSDGRLHRQLLQPRTPPQLPR
ncbi:MAG TPA: IS3 family transposase [Mycobacterium sp.]|nr:IS3 family transposase [Mycobacterium sp.]HTY32935.1 IS3 family transposase [Mycobacterium sp.]